MTDMIGGCRPWSIPVEPVRFITQGGATQAEIDTCLSCKVPQRECKGYRNCQKYRVYEQGNAFTPAHYSHYSYELFEQMLHESGTIKQKAFRRGISWQTYYNWKKKYLAEKSAKEGK